MIAPHRIERVMRELGFDYLQARNHLIQRDELARRQRVPGTTRRAAA